MLRRLSQEDDPVSLLWERESLTSVTGLWNMQEWPCAATCDNGKYNSICAACKPTTFRTSLDNMLGYAVQCQMPAWPRATASQYAYARGVKLYSRSKKHNPTNLPLPATLTFGWQIFLAQRTSRFTRNFFIKKNFFLDFFIYSSCMICIVKNSCCEEFLLLKTRFVSVDGLKRSYVIPCATIKCRSCQ